MTNEVYGSEFECHRPDTILFPIALLERESNQIGPSWGEGRDKVGVVELDPVSFLEGLCITHRLRMEEQPIQLHIHIHLRKINITVGSSSLNKLMITIVIALLVFRAGVCFRDKAVGVQDPLETTVKGQFTSETSV